MKKVHAIEKKHKIKRKNMPTKERKMDIPRWNTCKKD
jgi:hypothetical protein